jgi:hypothetical protein
MTIDQPSSSNAAARSAERRPTLLRSIGTAPSASADRALVAAVRKK